MSRIQDRSSRSHLAIHGIGTVLTIALVSIASSAPSLSAADQELKVIVAPKAVEIRQGKRLLVEYQPQTKPFKPYIKRCLTPAGINILRDAPHDHLHHHALMYAIGADGVDFWSEVKGAGKQVARAIHTYPAEVKAGRARAGFMQRIDWQAEGQGTPTLQEDRTITAISLPDVEASLISWTTRFMPGPGRKKVTLDGRHYFGLGMRFVTSMDKGGTFTNPDNKKGEVVRGTEKIVRSRWCAYTASVDGKPVTVAMFGHPRNPRHPTSWFTMTAPFAYLSATLNLYREPLPLEAGVPLVLQYGVALWDGRVSSKAIEAVYEKWLEAQEKSAKKP